MPNYQDNIARIMARIRELEESNTHHQNGINQSKASIAAYQNAGMTASNVERINAHQQAIVAHNNALASNATEMEELRSQLQEQRQLQAQYDAGLAQAAREGLTGAAGAARAQALVEESKAKKTLYIMAGVGGLILLVAGIIWWMRKRRAAIPAA